MTKAPKAPSTEDKPNQWLLTGGIEAKPINEKGIVSLRVIEPRTTKLGGEIRISAGHLKEVRRVLTALFSGGDALKDNDQPKHALPREAAVEREPARAKAMTPEPFVAAPVAKAKAAGKGAPAKAEEPEDVVEPLKASPPPVAKTLPKAAPVEPAKSTAPAPDVKAPPAKKKWWAVAKGSGQGTRRRTNDANRPPNTLPEGWPQEVDGDGYRMNFEPFADNDYPGYSVWVRGRQVAVVWMEAPKKLFVRSLDDAFMRSPHVSLTAVRSRLDTVLREG